MKTLITIACCIVCAGVMSTASAQLEIRKAQGVRYVTGGVTEQEREELGDLARRFPIHIVLLAKGADDPVTGAKLTVLDVSGNIVLQSVSEGPMFFVDVVGGRYTVEAEYKGEKQSQTKDLTGRRYLRLRFTFGE